MSSSIQSDATDAPSGADPVDASGDDLPSAVSLAWPSLLALRELGDSGNSQEILEIVVKQFNLSDEAQSRMRSDGLTTQLVQNASLARTYLVADGLISRSKRGVFAVTEKGRAATEADIEGISGRYATNRKRSAKPTEPDDASAEEQDWKTELLTILREMHPKEFEKLSLRVMREAGFSDTQLTADSGDEGIDGTGVHRISLLSFPVYFQCKRYSNSVGPDKIRDFRGAMAGRGDKGIFITTGTFTTGAKAEATRDGAPPIDLIDGEQFCDLLKDYDIGVSTQEVTKEIVEVDRDWFATI